MSTARFPAVSPKFPHMLHGGDYNPDQWLDMPEIINEDFRLAKLAHINAMSIGIFAWTALEPSDSTYTFEWLDDIMDRLAKQNMVAVLATPSGARPAWMSQKYPEVLRVGGNRVRNLHGVRHNHCYTSPVYRRKVSEINTRLAERYKNHPALALWHLSNEYGGECHCDLCQDAFRAWLKERYHNDLAALNKAWCTAFWSHTYTDWSQVESPAPHGENKVHAHNLDWKRFVTHQTTDFIRMEIASVKKITPDVPVTTNLMGFYTGLDYWKIAPHLDVVSWDSYPPWHDAHQSDQTIAEYFGFVHDLNRSLKQGKPFLLMESAPSPTNWQRMAKLRRPGMHYLASLQAVAHGSDSVQYFQYRKSRGSYEKFHGAVVDHVGHENTRVFQDVTDVGSALTKLDDVIGTTTPAKTAIIYDWENRWAIDDFAGYVSQNERRYAETCVDHYRPFWRMGIPADIIDQNEDFSKYSLIIAPMLYMVKPGVAERINAFVENGGTFVATYLSGIVDESDLCFLNGWPGPLRKTLGIWVEETDALDATESNTIAVRDGELGLNGDYKAHVVCDLMHAEQARVLGTYTKEFYAKRPAYTVNTVGKGRAYYHGARMEMRFLEDFYRGLAKRLSLTPSLDTELPAGVTARHRTDGKRDYVFVMNFTGNQKRVALKDTYRDMVANSSVHGTLTLPPYGCSILTKA
ncbi:MAG: beta-galactosidase [Spirochaetes bacterium]|nr:beta-galactosidase [Spirochaetota bacterium]